MVIRIVVKIGRIGNVNAARGTLCGSRASAEVEPVGGAGMVKTRQAAWPSPMHFYFPRTNSALKRNEC